MSPHGMADPDRRPRSPGPTPRLPRVVDGRVVIGQPAIDFEDVYHAWADDLFGDRGLTLPMAGLAKCHDLFGLSPQDQLARQGH